MTKGNNQEEQKKPNRQRGAKTISQKQQRDFGNIEGRNRDEAQVEKKTGSR